MMKRKHFKFNCGSLFFFLQGSECSIRITSNPHPEANGNATGTAKRGAAGPSSARERLSGTAADNEVPMAAATTTSPVAKQPSCLDDVDIPPIDGVADDNVSVSDDISDDSMDQRAPLVPPESLDPPGDALDTPPPVPPHATRPASLHHPSGAGRPPSGECFDWDYEQMGMTYDQLMDYFDNLKESTA